MSDKPFHCGFVAVVGRPNVGKSTLINTILGSKISIVTPKPQTTRHRILGVDSHTGYQVIYIDTPGLHRNAGKAMNRMMNRTAANALMDAEVIMFVTEANRWTVEDQDVLERIQNTSAPVIAVMNKMDKVHPREMLLQAIAEMSARHEFAEVIPISAKLRNNVDRLVELVPGFLPESPPLFPEDMITDRSENFRIAEVVREKLTLALRQEVPYGLTVQVERFERDDNGIAINAIIWIDRDSQKGIVVGKGGKLLKKVGRAARLELKAEYGVPVHLELWVKVKDNWSDNEKELLRLGYESL
ncbi:MAG: GTPase Era [Gammaproteobacteria bacterium]|nr:MAG: GTPase Era [Gammaproteobacteria bacterium]RLA35351.1 MAG: GTPase Era [Gammaproteobacteria bacterium]